MSNDSPASARPPEDSASKPTGPATGPGGGGRPRWISYIVGVALLVVAAGVLWKLLGESLYEQVVEYRIAARERDMAAPVGYVGLNYRKTYNSRAPQFLFDEGERTLLWASVGDGETPEFYDVTEARFDPIEVHGGFGRDSIPGVDYPIFQDPDGEVARNLGQDAEVVGLQRDGELRAVPIDVLKKVEVVNAKVGQDDLALVYARGSDKVGVFPRNVDGASITFGTTGYAIADEVPLLYDRRTLSLWLPDLDHGAMNCVSGDLEGTTLPTSRPFERLSWRSWRGSHPKTTVLVGNDRSKSIPEQ